MTRFGGAYAQFLILDADSLMTGETLVRLAGAMERHPDVGLIQTLPIITGAATLFARVQQFAGRVYGPLIAHGIAWWHGTEGNYWGHNAMIRTRAFAEQAGLPELAGRKPFGGPIMSHDFVEAALMRRGGWAVHMVPGVRGSYEEVPPTLTDLAVRDRRWCQGNLQHLAVLPTRGLYAISRLHLLTGIGSYITAPLWLLFILTGILIAVQARFVQPDYFPLGKSLFPQWPVIDPVRAMWMFVATMALLLVPKLLGCVTILLRRTERRGFGAVRLVGGILFETLVAGLIAPVVMLTQTIDVVAILLGRDSGWNAQRRDDGAVPGARDAAAVPASYGAGVAARCGGVGGLALPCVVDAAGGARPRPGNSAGAADRPAMVQRSAAHARGPGTAAGGRAGGGAAPRMAVGGRDRRGAAPARAEAAGRAHGDAAAAAPPAPRSDRCHAGARAGEAGGGGRVGCRHHGVVGIRTDRRARRRRRSATDGGAGECGVRLFLPAAFRPLNTTHGAQGVG